MTTDFWSIDPGQDNTVVRDSFVGSEGLARLNGISVIDPVRPSDFYLEQLSVRLGHYTLRRVDMRPMTILRSKVDNSSEQLRLVFLLKGSITVTQAGREIVLQRGDGAVAVGWQSYRAEVHEDSSAIFTTVDREMLESRAIIFPHAVRKLSTGSALPVAAAAFLAEFFEPRFYPRSPRDLGRIVQVIDTFFMQLHLSYIETFRTSDDRKSEQRESVLAYIREHAHEASLTVARVAEHHGRSVRSLQRLFYGTDITLRDEIASATEKEI
ncbi:hypothetical protein [Lysinibacter sp. HNR]|uniref:AraC-like ligand-binding domain-containing protein n=1 Tax=Lysinibacter sp. HNR TaxID=3031408 RepID=UPI002435BF14|nr:hypothetical protein [Lysinibacter sp. HNR]WGD37031.1 hypothetical protein FrondiHNR_11380 [Lysinibacter sp. HNR]